MMDRRRFLSSLTVLAGAALGALVSIPLLGHLFTPLLGAGDGLAGGYLPIGMLDDFPPGPPRRVTFPVTTRDGWTSRTQSQAAWVLRTADGGVTVLTSVCPHLGCSIQWKASRSAFQCPCHESEFSSGGERRHGPARRGMDPLPSRVVAGQLQVRWEEYVAGIAERRPMLGGGDERAAG
jgi:Rieske Fe-S protein